VILPAGTPRIVEGQVPEGHAYLWFVWTGRGPSGCGHVEAKPDKLRITLSNRTSQEISAVAVDGSRIAACDSGCV
jgi:hypothetical protein